MLLTDASACAFLQALRRNATLQPLCLRSNAMLAGGGTALAEALAEPAAAGALTHLDLSHNALDAAGTAALAAALGACEDAYHCCVSV